MRGILFIMIALAALYSFAYAESDVPEGYDENTELTVKGAVSEITRGVRGPVVLTLQSRNKVYRVITAPPRYLEQEGIHFTSGDELEVMGSKFLGRDGVLYIMSRQIRNLATGKITTFRDSMCRPLWRGRGMQRGMQ